jgi:hypothetical protein
MSDDPTANQRQALEEADAALARAIRQMEAAIEALPPELADSCVSSTTPADLERLADVIRELPGDWS